MILLAVLGVLNSIIGLYYYLTVLKYVYLYRQEGDETPLPALGRGYTVALGLVSLGIIFMGVVFGPWFSLAQAAASTFAIR
jgi:NADH-quinone oxidoreductase subunit N